MQRVSEFTGNRVVLRIANVPSVVAVRFPGIGRRVPESRTVFQDTRPFARLSVPRGISLSQTSEKYGHMFRGVLFSLSDSYCPGR